MFEISGFNMKLSLVASFTYPAGLILTQFADDTDPMDVPAITIASAEMGLNGDMVSWSTPVPITVNIALIPHSEDDRALRILLNQNRVGRGRVGLADVCTLTRVMPNGDTRSLTQGRIISGPPMTSVASSGRMKSAVYGFIFEDSSGTF